MESIIITIDGASSTGKSSLAKAIAKHYGFKHIDSGAMYRALTFYAQDHNLLNDNKFNVDMLIDKLPTIDIDFTNCLLYTSPSPRDATLSRMPSSA